MKYVIMRPIESDVDIVEILAVQQGRPRRMGRNPDN